MVAAPTVGDEDMDKAINVECFKDNVVIDSDDEAPFEDEFNGIPVVQMLKDLCKELFEP